MGRKKACAVNEGMCIRLSRLLALPGLLVIWLEAAMEFLAGRPRLDPGGCDRGGWGEYPVCDWEYSPSSEVISVTRDEIPLTEGG